MFLAAPGIGHPIFPLLLALSVTAFLYGCRGVAPDFRSELVVALERLAVSLSAERHTRDEH